MFGQRRESGFDSIALKVFVSDNCDFRLSDDPLA
jgi:hypothetical protein